MKTKIYLLVAWLALVGNAYSQAPLDDGSWIIDPNLNEEWNYNSNIDIGFTSKWWMEYHWGKALGPDEIVVNVDQNVSFSNGQLLLNLEYAPGWHENTPYIDPATGNKLYTFKEFNYTAGMVWSRRAFTYGYFEAIIQPCHAQGFHGAFWLYGAGCDEETGRYYDEIDIVESKGEPADFTYGTNVHSETNNDCNDDEFYPFGKDITEDQSLTNSFNAYAVEWAPNYIIWYFNSEVMRVVWKWDAAIIPQHSMTVINGPGIDKDYGPYMEDKKVPNNIDVNLPAVWKTESIKRWMPDTRHTNNLSLTTTSGYSTYKNNQYIPKNLDVAMVNESLYIQTSDKLTLRAKDNVTLTKNILINPNGSGHFTVLVPDYD